MQTSDNGRRLIASREGLRLHAYRDSAGIWTIGYGHSSAAGPPKVTAGMTISVDTAMLLLIKDLRSAEGTVMAAVKVPLNQHEFDALVSLTFNIGGTAFKSSRLLRLINANQRLQAGDQFLVWNKARIGGVRQELAGLTRRRIAERQQFLAGDADAGRVAAGSGLQRPGAALSRLIRRLIDRLSGSSIRRLIRRFFPVKER